jgi:protein gp37
VFCASLADVFDNEAPDSWRTDLWKLIQRTPNLDWLLLTKRVSNVHRMLPAFMKPFPNVWIGITVVTQAESERDIPRLMQVPATVHFLSMEPLIESVDLRYAPMPEWVIVGGESGPHARRMDIEWVESIANQCREAGVPFFMKQGSQANWTEFKNFDEFHESIKIREFPNG